MEIGLSKNFAQTENKPEIFVRGTRSPRRPNFTVWNVQRISLTHEKLHFLHSSVQEVIYELINVLGHSSVI